MQRLLGDRPARALQLDVRSKHTCDERRPSRSVQRSRPSRAVIGFDTLAVLTVAGLIIMLDRVESRALAMLGQVGGSCGVPPERPTKIADEIPVRQGTDELFIAARSGQFHDDARLQCLLLIRALLRPHVVTTPVWRDLWCAVVLLEVGGRDVVPARARLASRANTPAVRHRSAGCSA